MLRSSEKVAMIEPSADIPRDARMITSARSEPKTVMDYGVMVWFFSWLGLFWLCSGGFVLVVFASPTVMKHLDHYPLIIPIMVLAGAICFALALAPWYFGIRCRHCRTRLHRMKTECARDTGNVPLRFHCEICNVIWETKLISGPGDPSSTWHS